MKQCQNNFKKSTFNLRTGYPVTLLAEMMSEGFNA